MLRTYALAIAIIINTPLAALAVEEWTSTDGPPGGDIHAFGIDGPIAIASTPVGIFRSENAGQSWSGPTRIFLGANARARGIWVSPSIAFIVSFGGEFFRSTDHGQSWSPLTLPVPPEEFAEIAFGSTRIFLRTASQSTLSGLLFVSEDNGDSWRLMDLSDVTAMYARGDELLVVSTLFEFGGFMQTGTLLRSTNQGGIFDVIGGTADDVNGLPGRGPSFGIGFGQPARLGDKLIAGEFVSHDDGQTWSPFSITDHTGYLWSWSMTAQDDTLFVYGYRADPGNPQPSDGYFIYTSADLENFAQKTLGALPNFNFQLDKLRASAGVVLYGDAHGFYRSTNAATSWSASNDGIRNTAVVAMANMPDGLIANLRGGNQLWKRDALNHWQYGRIFDNGDWGGEVVTLYHAGGDTLLAGHAWDGITRSLNAGDTWEFGNNGVPDFNGSAGGQFYPIVGFTTIGQTHFAVTGIGNEFICTGREATFQSTGGGILRSTDGANWQRFTAGLPTIGISCFLEPLIEPTTCITNLGSTLFVGTATKGIFRSTSNGASWQPTSTGIPAGNGVVSIVALGRELYTVVTTAEVFKSTDAGQTWQFSSAGVPVVPGGTYTLFAHAGDLYLGIGFVFPVNPGDFSAFGVYRLRAGLADWERVGAALDGVAVLSFAERNGALFAGTDGLGVYALTTTVPCSGPKGDADCDGQLTNFDIDPFVLALIDLPTWQTQYCNGNTCTLDSNCDGTFTNFDIDPFVECLVGDCASCN